MFVGGDADKLIELAKNEKDPELRKTAIRNLGLMKRAGTTEALTAHLRVGRVDRRAQGGHQRAVPPEQRDRRWSTLARAEKNVEMKKEIVSKLSNMKSKEATDYLHGAAEVSSDRAQVATGAQVLRAVVVLVLAARARAPARRAGPHQQREDRDAVGGAGAGARGAGGRRRAAASPGSATAMPMVAGPRQMCCFDTISRLDAVAAACAASRAAAACR